MYDKTLVFFSGINSIQDNKQELPIERVKKYIDAEIAYKKIIAERLLASTQAPESMQEETWEIILSSTVHLYDNPLQISAKFKSDETLSTVRKETINRTISDIKDCHHLKASAEKDSVDILFLNIYFQYHLGLIDIETSATKKNIKKLLDSLYPQAEATKLLKKIIKDVNCKHKNSPIMANIHFKKKMLAILETEISPFCQRFLEDVIIISEAKKYAVAFTQKTEARLNNSKLIARLQKALPNSLASSLSTEYFFASNALLQPQIVFGYMKLNDNYLSIFECMKVLYQVEDKIATFLLELERQEHEAKTERAVPLPEAISIEAIADFALVDEERQEIPTSTDELYTVNVNKTTEEIGIPQIIPQLTDHSSSLATEFSPVAIDVFKEDLEPQGLTVLAPVEINNSENTDESKKSNIDVELSEIETPIYTAIYQSYSSKNKERENKESNLPAQSQRNTLKLNKDHQDTFRKVFGLKQYDSINLRALVNLTLEFGGVIKKTGANRCRIEIKNIYAFILLPQELINPSTSSTVTMHGGGHRSTRSQNHDREKTPDYLIAQFRDAFTRSGFTPVNLGLDYSENSKSFTM